jgi:hypothetical protein
MRSFARALKATQLMLEVNPAGTRHDSTKNPSEINKTKSALNFVLNTLKANYRSVQRHEFIGNIQDAAGEIYLCQQNIERTFKLAWNVYAVSKQNTGRHSSVENVANIQDDLGKALNSVLHAFHLCPFALSPEGDTLAPLNHNHETATRYEDLARRIGRAWVDDRIPRVDVHVRDLAALQMSIFELLWSGTIEQLKRREVAAAADPERPEFEKALLELEMGLQEAIIRAKKRRFTIAFCGMAKAGKSMFLNALVGRAILPSDGESNGICIPIYHAELYCRASFYGLALPASSR